MWKLAPVSPGSIAHFSRPGVSNSLQWLFVHIPGSPLEYGPEAQQGNLIGWLSPADARGREEDREVIFLRDLSGCIQLMGLRRRERSPRRSRRVVECDVDQPDLTSFRSWRCRHTGRPCRRPRTQSGSDRCNNPPLPVRLPLPGSRRAAPAAASAIRSPSSVFLLALCAAGSLFSSRFFHVIG